VPRKLFRSRCQVLIGSEATRQLINSEQCQNQKAPFITRHITNTFPTFSLYSVRSKLQNSEKIEEQFTNPRLFQNQNSTKFNGVCYDSQRFSIESSSLNRFLYNSSANSPLIMANSSTITETRDWEEERTFEGFEPAKKKKKIHSFIRISSKN